MKSLRENVAYLKDVINNLQDLVQESEKEYSLEGVREIIDRTPNLEFIWMSENTWEKFKALFGADIDFLKDTEQRLRSLGHRGQYYNGFIVVTDTPDRIITLKFKNSPCIDITLKRDSAKFNKEIGHKELMPLTMTLREASNGGLINCLKEYPSKGAVMDLKRAIYHDSFNFTQLLSKDESFTTCVNKLHAEQDKLFVKALYSCADAAKQETSTVYNFDEKSFNTVRYLVERHRKSADYLLFDRTQLSDMVRDHFFIKNMRVDESRKLIEAGLVGKFNYTQFKTTASVVTEEPILPENIYALSSDGNGYHTRLEVSFNNETGLVTVEGEVIIAIDPKSVAKLTIFKNI